MIHPMPLRRLASIFLLLVLVAPAAEARSHRKPSRKSPHTEITAIARLETTPERRRHKNRREFQEFDIRIESFKKAAEGDQDGDPDLRVRADVPVHVVHDLTCGGVWLEARRGDRIELKGEYVQAGSRGDLIHFTHPADGSCGRAGGHPDGYLRRLP
ncbi:MAG: hypothetical protein ABIT01_04620 [Thermoanaerobaculia bacterium]